MYKTWVLVFSITVLLPLRWLVDVMPRVHHPLVPVLPIVALVTCSELVLNNPTISPAGPYCPGTNITISFTGTNLPEGDNINVYWGTTNNFNPFAGGGTLIGSTAIDYTCTTCPTIMAVMLNPATCNGTASNDEQNEFMVLGSGCGFMVSNFQLNPSVGGSMSNDSIGGSQGCTWSLPNATNAVNFILSNSTGCTGNIFAAGPGSNIPGGAIVVAFSDWVAPTATFNFQDLCNTGMPVYILVSSCNRTDNFGAYSNTLASSPSYTLTGCGTQSFSYNAPPTPGNTGTNNIVAFGGGSFDSDSPNCSDIGMSGLNFPDMPIATASLNYTIPAGICGSMTGTIPYYISGAITQNAPCLNTLYTPPANLAISIACPAMINPAGPFCQGGGTQQLTATPVGGTWSGGAYINSSGVFNPAVAGVGSHTVTYTVAPCGSVNATIQVVASPVISGTLDITNVPCDGASTGNVVFIGTISNYTGTDWDNADTPGNDVYPDDNSIGLANVPNGNYYFIAYNAAGCRDTLSFVIDIFDPVSYTSIIGTINCFGGTTGIFSGIDLNGVNDGDDPPGFYTYDWDMAGGANDDYGSPPATDDPEDIYNLSAGTYYLTITVQDDPSNPSYTCLYLDTFVITQPTQLVASIPPASVLCFGGNVQIMANASGGTPNYTYNWAHIAGTNNPNPPPNVGAGNYTVTVTDSKGCTATATTTVTQPASALTANATGETIACNDGTGDITLNVSGGTPTYTFDWSNDGAENPDNDPQNLSGLNGGTYTVTVTDANGCTTTAQATITVSPPTFVGPANQGTTVPCVSNAQTPPSPIPTVTDNCGLNVPATGPVVSADPSCGGTKTYTYTYTHPTTGQTATWVYTYTISPPTFSIPAGGSSTVACVANATTPTPPTVNNSCGAALSITGPVIGPNPACGGPKTYTYTYTDCTGNTGQWVYTYTISPPTISAPAPGSATVACVSNAQTVPTPPTVNNSCGQPTTVTGPVISPDPVCQGTKTYTWTYTDCTNNTVQYVFTYTINPPSFTLPANGASTVPCISNAQTVPTPPNVNDSCGNPITPTGPVVSPDPACSGTKTYTWTYTDCDGTSATWVHTYTISPPTISAPAPGSSTVPCIVNAQATPTPPAVNNSCGTPATITGPVVSPDPSCSGTKTYTWTYTDCTGNTVQYVYTYTISPPTFTLPAAGGSNVPCVSNAQTVPTPPTVMNSCGATITPTGPVVSPNPACGGTKTYTWTYTDCTGISQQWVYTYTIAVPTLTLPAPGGSTVPCISNAQTVPTPPNVNDSCGNPVTPTGPAVGADPVCSGTKTYTWTYTDCSGAAQQWVYTYTITPPTFSVPAPGGSTVACISNAQVTPTPPAATNSCGTPLTITGPVIGADPVCSGTKTYTFTYTDCTGSSQPWVYTYTISPPTVSAPAPGGSTVPCVSNAQVVPTPATVTNSCGTVLTPTGPVVSADPVCSGTKTYTWTYTDCTGNSVQYVYTYTINPPTATAPPGGSSTVPCIANAQVTPTPPSINNSCGNPLSITGPVVSPDPACSGPKTYTWTYTDCTGSTVQWVYTYTISPPTISAPAPGSATVACIANAQTPPAPPAVTNSCGTTITPTGPVAGPDPVCSGTKTYTWTYTDCTGTAVQYVFTYTISPPTFSVPAGTGSTVPCVNNAQTPPTPPSVSNSCGTPITPTGPVVSPDPSCGGIKTYTYTYTDCTGASQQWVYTYTIQPTTFTVPPDGGSTVACIVDAQVVPSPPSVVDACGNNVVPTGPVVGADPACSGTKTYTWTYTDCSGNSIPWVYTYTISPPTISAPAPGSATVACISNAQTPPTPPTVNNSCGTPASVTGPVIGADPVCSGTKTYTWTYTDCTGNTVQYVFTYTISPPTFSMPAPGGSTVPCVTNAQTPPSPPSVNNSCGAPLTITGPVIGPDPVCSGVKTYTYTYTDCTGASQQWVYTYTINPSNFTLPPPGSSTVPCISNAQTVPTPPNVNDSCGNPITPTGPAVSPDPACSGTKTYTWTYTDCSGGSQQWVYTYTISPPTITAPAPGSATVACIVNAQTVPTPPAVNNSCGTPASITGPVVSPDPACSGTKTYTWTYTDCTGNTVQYVFTYTISPPTFSVPAGSGSTVPCVNNAQTPPTPPTVNNSCGTPITPTGPVVSPDPTCGGIKTYTYTYTDCTGASQQWVYTYTIQPTTFTVPPDDGSTVPCIVNAQVVPSPPAVVDACGNNVVPTGPVIGADPVCSGTKTYTWTYTDCSGNSIPWVYTYTVSPPTISAPAPGSATVACISNAQTPPTPPAVNNSCGTPASMTGPVVGPDPVCSGTKTYTWTYTDCTGSSVQYVFTYTISPPTFSMPAPGGSTVPCVSNAQTPPTPPTVNNSCGAPLAITGPVIGPDPVCSGVKTYTYTYTDCTGASQQWVYTYTINPSNFTLPAPGSSTVPCIINAQTVPTPPNVNDSCGNPITPTGPVVSPDPACSGTKTYTWTYTDCSGGSQQWVYTYTISPPTISAPAPGSATVPCIADAQSVPTPPAVNNSCGTPATITGPVIGPDPACSGTKTYTWTYTDCTGSSVQYVFTYTINPPTFSLPAPGSSTVPCVADAQTVPAPPSVTNSCGATISPTGPVVGPDPVCGGTKTYTWTYTDCGGASQQWVFTYTVSPTTFTLPAPGGSTVPCIADAQAVPSPPNVTDSCGDPVVPTGPVVGPDPVCSGTKTYTWTYTDCSGGSSDWVYTYTISPPTISAPAPGSATVACVSNAQTPPTPPAVNNSCGTPATMTGPVVSPDPVCSGTKTYTWTYTDCTGSSVQYVFTYTINPPTFTLPAPGGSTVACVSDAQVVPTPPNVNDSCGNPIVPTGPVVSPDPVCTGTKTYTWTYTDCTGASQQWVYTYTITPSTLTLPAPGSSTVNCVSDAQVVPTPPNVNDSCGNPVTPTGPVVGPDPVCTGTKTYTWTYTDCSGAAQQWVYTYTVSPPTVAPPAPGSATVPCIADAQAVPTPPALNNSCGDPLSITGPVVDPDPVCSGTKTYTWTYTDCTGSTVQYVFTYTINPPTFTLPAPGSSTVPCVADAQTVPTPPSVTNSCGTTITPTGPVVSPDPVCGGTKTYTWTYTDCTGSAQDWVFTYTISPTTFTLPAAGSATVPCIADAQVVPSPPNVTDSCGDPVVPTGPVVGPDPVCSGTKTYTWTYTDCSGGSSTWVFTYTISPPTISAPAPGSATVACISDAQTVPTPPTVNNSCGTPTTVTGPVISPDPVCSGTKTYTWTYTDCTGSSVQYVFTYTINPPTFTLPAPGSSTVPCVSDAQVVPTPPNVNDSCGNPIVPTGPVVSPDPVCTGTKTYTWTYTDCTGASQDWVYTYTITPSTLTLPAPGSSTVNCVSDAQTVPTPPNVNDSCGNPVTPTGPVIGPDPVCSGTKTYTWTYTDCSGAAQQWVYTYTISPPTVTPPAPGSATVACIADAQVVPTPPALNNSCGDPLSITGPVVSPDPVCSGTKTYTWTYTDCTGSTVQYVFTYTINPPTFTLPAPGSSTVPCVADAQVVPTPPSVTNSCGATITPTGPVVGPDPVCGGTKTYTWTYTDCTGSAQDWVYTYTISPVTFTLPAPGGSTVPCIADAQVVPTPPNVTDSCGDPVVPTGPVVGPDPVCSGTKTYTWTYTDCSGNSLPWVYTYTINPPTFTLPAPGSATVPCIADAQTVPTPPNVNDSCGNPIVPTGPAVGADPVCSGTKTYTWTYTDCSGAASQWVFTYTVSPPTFTLPAPGSSTVPCVSNAQTVPTPPSVNNSCGAPLSVTGPVVGPDPVCSGTKTYTWTYTDCTGSSQQWVYTYTVSPPSFTLPAPGSSTVNCVSDAQTVPTPPNVNDSCGNPITPTGPVIGPDPVCSGTKTYTWTYTDCTGASQQWVYTYTISPPTVTPPAPGSATVPCIADAQAVPTPPALNNSCGDPLSITGPVIGPDPVCSGTKTYTWTYTDCTGSTVQYVFTYTINPPTFTIPAPGSATVPCVADAQVVPTPPSVTNSCGATITPTGPVIGPDPVCGGTKTYTWTYTDCTGSAQDWVFTYTVSPATVTLPAPGGSTVACIADAQVVPTPPSVNDSCGDPITPTGPVVGPDPVCSGTKTYTWTYADCSGNSLQWVYTYTINAPTFSLPAPGSATVPCIADAQTVPTPPNVNDSCGNPIVPTGPVVGADPVCSGTKTYTWTYTDCSGASSQWVFTYTVSPPTFTMPAPGSSTVPCVADAQVVPTPPSVNNSCGTPLAVTGPVVGPDPVCSGTKTYTWTFTDCTGSSQQWVYTYTINPPTFTLPAPGSSTVPCIADAQVVPTPPSVVNSCGVAITPTGPVVGPDPVCSGTKTYTWTYTDCTGASQDWVYTYTINPPTFTLPAAGAATVACVSDAQVVPTPPSVTNSCGGTVTPTGPVIGPDPVCSGTKTYTWTYTDCTGASQDWVFTYTVTPPTFTLPAPGSATVACISDAQVVPTPPSVVNSCGDPITPTGPVVGADPVCSGTKTYTWTYTDCTGSSQQWVFTYTITPPTFTLPAPGSSTVPCIADAQVVPTPPSVVNSCGDPVTPTGPVVGPDPVCAGTKTYTWTFTDCTGSSQQWVYTYTIPAPTFTLPAPGGSTVPCIADAQVVPTPPSVNNSCGVPVIPTGPVVGPDPVCSGLKTYTWTYTDCDGTNQQWVYTYTINAPAFSLPAPGSATVNCVSDAQTVPTPPNVNDSCGNPITPTGPVVGPDPVCSGTKTYTWTYTDCSGASSQWVFTYTISPPTFTLPAPGAVTVACVADAQVVPTPPNVNDSCGNPITPTGPVVGPDPVCEGTKTYTWTYTDCAGNAQQWVFTYTVTPPSSNVPANGGSTVACVSDAQVIPTPPSVNNSCGDPLSVTGPVIGPDPVCSGTKTYTWTFTDCTGNSADWVYIYTISPPSLTLPAPGSSTVACISEAQVVPTPPNVNDSCGNPVTPTGPVVGADPVCSGTKTYTWTYTDCAGNSEDWVYTYTINPPTFTMPADDGSAVPCIADAQVIPSPPTVNNSCGAALSITGPVIGPDPICGGDKTYTWTYTDCTGSSQPWVYTYTINTPTLTLPAPGGSNVPCVQDAQVVPTPPNVVDNCGDPVIPTGPVVGPDPVCAGTKTYTWTYTDCGGGTADWVYTYTIPSPTFTLPANGGSTVDCVSDAQVVPTPPAVVDNCGNPVTPTGPVVGPDPVCSGTKTYTWTYTDCGGGTSDWVYTYTINPPAFTLPADGAATVNCIADAQVVPTPPSANNSCGIPLTVSGPVVGADPVCSGDKIYTFTYTDCNGATDTWVFTYTINPPTFTLPADDGSTVTCVSDAQVVPTPPAATNSCGDPLTLVGFIEGPDPVCQGAKTYTFTYTDCTGASAEWVYTYTVLPSTLSLPADDGSTVACVSDAQVVPTPPNVNDSCGNPVTPTGPVVSPDPVCSGTKTYTWTFTDCAGTPFDWVYTYTISPPSIALPPNDGSTVACVSDAQVVPTPPTANDSCGDPVIPTGPVVSPDPVCTGIKTYTWTYSDCTGNTAEWVYTYTIDPPSLVVPPNDGSTVLCIADAQVVPTPPNVNDSCGNPANITGPVVGPDPVCSGTKTYTFTYSDCAGNTSQWVYTYTITGDTGPVFTAPPADVTVDCVADIPPMISLSYTNSCSPGGTVPGTDSNIVGTCPATVIRTWTATDACGNVATVTQNITVDDTTPPTATAPPPITVPDCNGAVPAPDINLITDEADNCGVPVVAFVSDAATIVGCTETTTRTYSITDACNNSITVTQTITRTVDTTPPAFVPPLPFDITVNCIGQVPPMEDLDYTDDCGGGGTVTGVETGPVGDPPTITRTWTATDACGNVATTTQTIVINETAISIPVTEDLCPGDTVTINGEDYFTPGTYTDTIPGQNGECDTIINITINGLPYNEIDLSGSFCPGESVIVDGEVYNTAGTFVDTLQGVSGECDTIRTVVITELPYNQDDLSGSFCPGGSITINGIIYDVAGVYTDTLDGAGGECDTIVEITITQLPYNSAQITEDLCPGETVMINGEIYDTPGTYTDTLTGVGGECDTILQITINGLPYNTASVSEDLCPGETVTINGEIYDTQGTYTDTLDGVGGECDTILTININELPYETNNYNEGLCGGQSITIHGVIYDTPGTYIDTVPGPAGLCDSILNIIIFAEDLIDHAVSATICANESITIYGEIYDTGGTFLDTVPSTTGGCDTAVVITITETPLENDVFTYNGCEGDGFSITINGTVYDESNPTGTDTLFAPGPACDTILDITLTFAPNIPAQIEPEGPVCTTAPVITLQATPAGGVWSGDVSSNQFDPAALGIGTHEVIYTVTGGSCSSADTINIVVYELVISCAATVEESAPGAADGEAEVTISGGDPDYVVSWSGPSSGNITVGADGTFVIPNLTGGVYTVTVTDETGCSATCQFTIISNIPCLVQIDDVIVTPASCSGVDNGSATVVASSGIEPYEYSLDCTNWQTSPTFPGLAPGNYTICVRDDSGCIETSTFSIGVGPSPVIDLIAVTNASCGVANGVIEVEGTGGDDPYMYALDMPPYGFSGEFQGLNAGTYTILLLDEVGCGDTLEVTVGATGAPEITISTTNASCGQADGTITVNASGGVPPYTYILDGTITQNDPNNTFTGVTGGSHTIQVEDATGCLTPVENVNVPENDAPTITGVLVTETECDEFTGTITITATGGSGDYLYSINGGTNFSSSNIFTGLGPGVYDIVVQDESGCEDTDQVTVNTIDGPQINNIDVTHTSCGEENGIIDFDIVGGTEPYTIIIDGGPYSNDEIFDVPITDLEDADYCITVTDDAGCSAVFCRTVEDSDGPELTYSSEPAHCGRADGCLILDGQGVGPFMYSINGAGGPFSFITDFCNLPSEFYDIAVKDGNGCIVELVAFVGEVEGPTADSVQIVAPDCGLTNGMVTVFASGGTPPLEYSTTGFPPQPSPVFSPIAPGTYTITVTDDEDCSSTIVAVVPATPAPNITGVVATPTECGESTGTITITATGGAGLTYSINGVGGPFVSTNVFTGLPSGNYDIVVQLPNGCQDTDFTSISSTGAPTGTLVTSVCAGDCIIIGTDTFCVAGDYSVTLPGGAVNGCDSIVELTLTIDPLEEKTIFESVCVNDVYTYNGVDYTAPGIYVIDTVDAATGCDTILTVDLSPLPLEVLNYDVTICTGTVWTDPITGLTYNTAGTTLLDTLDVIGSCDSIRFLNLAFDDFVSSTFNQEICQGQTFTINGLNFSIEGVYPYDTIDAAGACDTILFLDLVVNPLPIMNAGADKTLDCNVQTVTLDGSTDIGTPLWTGPDINAGNENDLTPDVSVEGIYTLTVTTSEGCVASDQVEVLLDPASAVADAGPADTFNCIVDTIFLQGGPTGPNITYQWSGPGIHAGNEHDQNPLITVPGTYTLVVTDQVSGCTSLPDQVVIPDNSYEVIAIIEGEMDLTCFIDTIDLASIGSTTGPAIKYLWFDENLNLVASSPNFIVTQAGEFLFVVLDTLTGCSDSTTIDIDDLTQYPQVNAGPDQILDCNIETVLLTGVTNINDNIIHDWSGPAGGILTDTTLLSVTVGSPGMYVFSAMDTTLGCLNSDTVLVMQDINAPIADIDILETITCIDETALLDIGTSSTGTDIQYGWTGPGFNNVDTTQIEPSVAGTFILNIFNSSNGCEASDTVTLTVPVLPSDMVADIEIPFCLGDTTTGAITITNVVGGTPPFTYSLNGGDPQSTAEFDSLGAGTFNILVTDANGCTYEESFVIAEGEELTLDIGPDLELELGDEVELDPIINFLWSDIDSIVWSLGDSLSCTHCQNPILIALNEGLVAASVWAGNCYATDTLEYRVDINADIYIPNIFSPNNDYINDGFTVYGDDRVKKIVRLEIFDRWGNQVFVTTDVAPNDPLLGWDGTFKDKPMNPAVFAYIATVELINGTHIDRKGDVTIVR